MGKFSKYWVAILALGYFLLPLSVSAHEGHAQTYFQTNELQNSKKWADIIAEYINLGTLDATPKERDYASLENESLKRLMLLTINEIDAAAYRDTLKISKYYMERAQKEKSNRHIKISQTIYEEITTSPSPEYRNRYSKYTEDNDSLVAFVASWSALHRGIQLGAPITSLQEWTHARQSIPSADHEDYEIYRYIEAIGTQLISSLSGRMDTINKAAIDNQKYAKILNLEFPSWFTAHNLLTCYTSLYHDEKNLELINMLYEAAGDSVLYQSYALWTKSSYHQNRNEFSEALKANKKMLKADYPYDLYRGPLIRQSVNLHLYMKDSDSAEQALEEYKDLMKESADPRKLEKITNRISLFKELKTEKSKDIYIDQLLKSYQLNKEMRGIRLQLSSASYQYEDEKSANLLNVEAVETSRELTHVDIEKLRTILTTFRTANLLNPKTENILNTPYYKPQLDVFKLSSNSNYQTLANYKPTDDLIYELFYPKPEVSKETSALIKSDKEIDEVSKLGLFALLAIKQNDSDALWQSLKKLESKINTQAGKPYVKPELSYLKMVAFSKEGNTSQMLEYALEYVNEAIEAKININNAELISILAHNLLTQGYYEEALETINYLNIEEQSSSSAYTYLKAKILNAAGRSIFAPELLNKYPIDENDQIEKKVQHAALEYNSHALIGADTSNAMASYRNKAQDLSRKVSNRHIQNLTSLMILQGDMKSSKLSISANQNTVSNLKTRILSARDASHNAYISARNKHEKLYVSALHKAQRTNRANRVYLMSILGLGLALSTLLSYFLLRGRRRHKIFEEALQEKTNNLALVSSLARKLTLIVPERARMIERSLRRIKSTLSDDKAQSNLGMVLSETEALIKDIESIGFQSSLAAFSKETPLSRFDPLQYQSRMLKHWTQQIKGDQVTLNISCDPDIKPFRTQTEIFEKVINTLVERSINSTLFGTITINMTAKPIDDRKGWALVSVQDTGDGLTLKNSTKDIIETAIETLSGTINQISEPGKGTVVKLSIPVEFDISSNAVYKADNVLTYKRKS